MHMHEVICLINIQCSGAALTGTFLASGKYSVISADPSLAPWRSEQKAVGGPQPCQVLPPTGWWPHAQQACSAAYSAAWHLPQSTAKFGNDT